MWLPRRYALLLAYGLCFLDGSLGFCIGRAASAGSTVSVSMTDVHDQEVPLTFVYIHQGIHARTQTTTATSTTSHDTSTTSTITKKTTTTPSITTITTTASSSSSSSSSILSSSSSSSSTSSSSTPPSSTSPSTTSSSATAIAAAVTPSASSQSYDKKHSAAMFTAGCFMAVFFSLALVTLIIRMQWKRLAPILQPCQPAWDRVVSAMENSQLWFYETSMATINGMRTKTEKGTKRVTRLFEFDYRAKSLPPTPSTVCELPISSEMLPPTWSSWPSPATPFLIALPVVPATLAAPAALTNPAAPVAPVAPVAPPTPPTPPEPVSRSASASPSPWPRPLELRRQMSNLRFERRTRHPRHPWYPRHPPRQDAHPIELPASPVSSQMLQERRRTVLQNMGYPNSTCNSPEPEIQEAQLQRVHRIQRMHNIIQVVRPPSPVQQSPHR